MLTNARFQDDWAWVKNTFTVSLGTDFETYQEILEYSLQDEIYSKSGVPELPDSVASALNGGTSDDVLPVYFAKAKCRDSSLGGNDAINCYYQFCENDDISHPFLTSPYGDTSMGRVYSEAIDDAQQILYLTFGVPRFNSLTNFFLNGISTNMAKLMNTNESYGISDLGQLIGQVATTVVILPALPFLFLNKVLGGLRDVKITKYYDFKSAMDLYYRCANTIIQHIAVNMGLASDGVFANVISSIGSSSANSSSRGGSNISSKTAQERLESTSGSTTGGLPSIFQKTGYDIYRIIHRKYEFEKQGFDISKIAPSDQSIIARRDKIPYDQLVSTDGSSSQSTNAVVTFFEDAISSFEDTLYDATLFIGLKVERSVDTSETLSHQIGESNIAQTINSKMQAQRELTFSAMKGNLGDGALMGALEGVAGFLKGIVEGASQAFDVGALNEVIAGNGVYDIPEVWKGSSFDKSYSFNLPLRSIMGDPISILQSEYIPLALIMAGSFPRAIGSSAYTSPFVCRAYCKGMFSVPLGIIDNVTIKRGGDQHGWNWNRLPTAIDVSFTIKDLSPSMYIGISGGVDETALTDSLLASTSILSMSNQFDEAFGANTSFQEYLLTLSGMGLGERLDKLQALRRKAEFFLNMLESEKLSPYYWAQSAGASSVGRMLSAVIPGNKIPSSN